MKAVDIASERANKLFMQKGISGLVRYGIFSEFRTRSRLAGLNMNLAEDFVILNDGGAPTPYASVSMLGAGLLIWFFMLCDALKNILWRWRRRRWFHRQRIEE